MVYAFDELYMRTNELISNGVYFVEITSKQDKSSVRWRVVFVDGRVEKKPLLINGSVSFF